MDNLKSCGRARLVLVTNSFQFDWTSSTGFNDEVIPVQLDELDWMSSTRQSVLLRLKANSLDSSIQWFFEL